MRQFALFLLSSGLVGVPLQSDTTNLRRVDYPQENFSIAIPATWNEIQPAALAGMQALIRQAVPNAPELRVQHGFRGSETTTPGYPWVAIAHTEGRVDESMFKKMDWAYDSVNELFRRLESSRGILEKAQLDSMSYDKTRHLLWGISTFTLSNVGDFQTLAGAYITTTGSIQVHCVSKVSEYKQYQSVCKDIIESVVIDPSITIPNIPIKSPVVAGKEAADYRTLVQRVQGGDFTIDFRALRLACMKSAECEPRGTTTDLRAMSRADNDHQFANLVEIAERLISQGFVNIEAHAECVKAYEAVHDAVKSKFHLDVTTALMRSILDSGDGKAKETAFEVISTREEYFTLAALGLPYVGSGVSASAIEEVGHRYARWDVLNPKNGQSVRVFFNEDAFSAKSRVHEK
jgi:hypothetical protein